ncbi:MAG: 2-C-methyl-D-erythritol 4-phosphate cytidylyltransferase [Alicyclobacillus sp.]|nr:2-C-methyl-D-erythritol 4-phosphate cytidylyltransferase [Alicyclobacillus sp.]
MRTYGILVAAGHGTRMGFRKQYTLLAGLPMWERAAEALLAGGVEHVWVVVPPEDVAAVERHVTARGRESLFSVVAGGSTRCDSVRHGLSAVLSVCREQPSPVEDAPVSRMGASDAPARSVSDVLVAVHDAARPFVLAQDVEAVIAAAERCGGAVLGQPCADTIKRVDDGRIVETVPRAYLWQAQTPQVFRASWLWEAYQRLQEREVVPTDDAEVVERGLGYRVQMVRAQGWNLKVTTPSDLEFAHWLAERRWGGERACSGLDSGLTFTRLPRGGNCTSEG